MKLTELAKRVGGEVCGDGDPEIVGIAQIDDVRPDEITFLDAPRYLPILRRKNPAALLVKEKIEDFAAPQVLVAEPRLAALAAAAALVAEPVYSPGIHPSAVIDPEAQVDPTATVMALCYVGPRAKVGPHSVLMPQVYLGPAASVGAACVLHPGVRVGERCRLGDRVICHHNVSIGADGYGYLRQGDAQVKIPQKGIVVIENDVEIGACSCIDRATFGRTVLGEGTKIDNLVQVGHNDLIGKRCLLVAQSGLSGSVVVGDDVIFAARSGAISHVRIGNGAVVGGLSNAAKDVGEGRKVGGVIAQDHLEWKRQIAAVKKLPEALREIRRLAKRVEELERK